MSDPSTDSSDQDGFFLRYVHPETYEPITSIASIKNLENTRAGVVDTIKRGLSSIILILTACCIKMQKCVNLDGAAVNLGAKNSVANLC